jgi:anti-anti-sigma regulatory factor
MIVESYEDVILLSGALRSNFWETIHTAISLTLKRHPTGVIIDCSGITECTPDGAETFRDAMDFIEAQDARVIVAAVPENVREVLRSVPEVRSQLPIARSVEEARHSLDLLVDPEGVKPRPAGPKLARIVLLLTEGDACPELFELAGEMAEAVHAEMVVTYVVIVPRNLPIQAPMADEEQVAAKELEAAKKDLAARNIPYSIVLERGRDVASALETVVKETGAIRVLCALSAKERELDDQLKALRSVLTKIALPVVIVRPRMER